MEPCFTSNRLLIKTTYFNDDNYKENYKDIHHDKDVTNDKSKNALKWLKMLQRGNL